MTRLVAMLAIDALPPAQYLVADEVMTAMP